MTSEQANRQSRAGQSRDDNDALCVSIAPGMPGEKETQMESTNVAKKDFCGFCLFFLAFSIPLSLSRFALISFAI